MTINQCQSSSQKRKKSSRPFTERCVLTSFSPSPLCCRPQNWTQGFSCQAGILAPSLTTPVCVFGFLLLLFSFDTGSYHVTQAGLDCTQGPADFKLASASRVTRFTGLYCLFISPQNVYLMLRFKFQMGELLWLRWRGATSFPTQLWKSYRCEGRNGCQGDSLAAELQPRATRGFSVPSDGR